MTLDQRRLFALWALAMLALLLLRLGAPPLFDVDEGAFSEATREMLDSGDFGFTTLNGAWRFDKPIGVYWLQAASAAVFGLSEFAMRLPSALSAWGWCVAVAAFMLPRLGLGAALLGGTMLGTCVGVMAIGHAATADALLNLLLTLAGLDLWRYLEATTGARANRARVGSGLAALRRAYAFIGLGLLVKGPVALVVPGAAALVWVVASQAWQPARRALTDWRGWLLLLAIAVPWYAYALHRLSQAFIDGFLMKHNVDRYTGTLEGHSGSLGYYVGVLPMLWLPWSPLLWAVVSNFKRYWAAPMQRFMLGWAIFVIAFFSLSGTKLPHYVLYAASPLAILMALELAQAGRGMRIALGCSLGLLVALQAGLPLLLPRLAGRIDDPLYRALLQGAPLAIGPAAAYAVVALACGALLATGGRFRKPPRPAAAVDWMPDWSRYGRAGWKPPAGAAGTGATGATGAAGGVVRQLRRGAGRSWRDALQALSRFEGRFALAAALTTAATFCVAVPWWGDVLQGPVERAAGVARAALAAEAPPANSAAISAGAAGPLPTAVQWTLHQPSFGFYLRRPAPRREPQPGELALVRVDHLPPDVDVKILYQERGYALVRRLPAP
jgi:4-amino-4-deoxy-L-arabinose transferase-like glycosyltransferase